MTVVERAAAPQHAPTPRAAGSERLATPWSHVPAPLASHLSRQRLSGLLASATAPLVLLSAPAGSGKTTLAAEWGRGLKGKRNVVWVSADGSGSEPWDAIASALGRPGLLGPSPARRPPRHLWTQWIVDAAGESSHPWTVFLDGYDVRRSDTAEDLHRLLSVAGDKLQIVLATRADPVLPLHRYRLSGGLVEVRAADLAFTDGEAAAFLSAAGVRLCARDVRALNERLSGWVAGLRFALPVLARHPAPQVLVSRAVTYNGNINAFLVEEVLDAQTPGDRELVFTTSTPQTLSPDLLQKLTGAPAALIVSRLTSANVFVEGGQEDASCLRYMPFFRDLVQAQFAYEEPDRFRQVHRTASDWYAGRGDWQRAVEHLDHAGEHPDCSALFVDHLLVGRLLFEQRGGRFRRLVARSSLDGSGPRWQLVRAASALADSDLEGCSARLDHLRSLGLAGREAITLAVIDAVLTGAVGDPRGAERLADRAMEMLVTEPPPGRQALDDVAAALLLVRARSALRVGEPSRADRLFEAAQDTPTAQWSSSYQSTCLAHLALLHARSGAVERATAEAASAVVAADAAGAAMSVTTPARLASACAAAARGDLHGARVHLSEAGVPTDHLWAVVRAVVTAVLQRSAGDAEQADATLRAVVGAAGMAGPWASHWRDEAGTWASSPPLKGGPGSGAALLLGVEGTSRHGAEAGRFCEALTPREVEVLAAMSEWLTTEEIAASLFISVNTVRTHVRNILSKLGVTRRNAAIRQALRLGLVTANWPAVVAPSSDTASR
jgi:LuxR family maltose regulon positive regulatory protein